MKPVKPLGRRSSCGLSHHRFESVGPVGDHAQARVRRQAVVVERRLHHRAGRAGGFGHPGEMTAQLSVALDPSRDHMQMSSIRTRRGTDSRAVDRHLDLTGRGRASATGALPFILLRVERSGLDSLTGRRRARGQRFAFRLENVSSRDSATHQGNAAVGSFRSIVLRLELDLESTCLEQFGQLARREVLPLLTRWSAL